MKGLSCGSGGGTLDPVVHRFHIRLKCERKDGGVAAA
jgi:hypothetical protein